MSAPARIDQRAAAVIEPHADRPGRVALGADQVYDAQEFVNELHSMKVTLHVAAKAKNEGKAFPLSRHFSAAR